MSIAQHLEKIEKTLDSWLGNLPVEKAARYSVMSGGKRLRPLLTLATAEALGAPIEHALYPACALELVHTYSMIHDDLPAMDNDDLRRGRPTLHKVYTEGEAILTGDYLLTIAFEKLASAPHLSADERLELIRLISQKSGAEGMITGQWIDLASENQKLSLEETDSLHLLKTGALIEASILAGAIVAKASPAIKEALSLFAKKLGLAFQIIDDVLDHTHPEEKHGVKSDIDNQKSTYVSLLGVKKAEASAQALYQEGVNILSKHKFDFELLNKLATMMVFRSK